MTRPSTTRRPPPDRREAARAARTWAALHLRRLLRRRGVLVAILAMVIAALLLRFLADDAGSSGARRLLAYPTPLLALFFGSGALREEIEDRTLTYAFTRPIPRAWLYYARVAAHLAPLLLALVPALAIIADDGGALVRYALAGVLASLAYGTVFALFGALSRGAAWVGLGYLIWEHAALRVPGFLQDLSLLTYVHGLAGVSVDVGLLGAGLQLPAAATSGVVLGGVAILATLAGGRLVERREIVIER